MTAEAQVHVGDIDTKFEVQILDQDGLIVSLVGATALTMTFQKPDGTVLTVTATVSTTGLDGKMYYDSISTTLDQDGKWVVQGKVVFSNGLWHTGTKSFYVAPNLA